MGEEVYIPASARNLKDIKFPQIRLGLQGSPGTGKTTGALTFPNPLILALEPGYKNWVGQDIPMVPFWDQDWVKEYEKGKFKQAKEGKLFDNVRDALIYFLKNECLKMKHGQTLVFDSWSAFQTYESYQTDLDPHATRAGKVDDFYPYQKKIEYATEVMTLLCSMKCHVVVTFHESQIRDTETGRLLDQVAPLMQGKFVAEIKRFFPDYYRCIAEDKKDPAGKVISTDYKWQVRTDSKFVAKSTLNVPEGQFFVEPHFNVFTKYAKTTAPAN